MVEEKEHWYRMEDRAYSVSSGWGDDTYYTDYRVELRKFEVIRHTSKGVWLRVGFFSGERWVNASARKRFACSTIEEALASFVARKDKQARIYENRAQIARLMKDQAIRRYGSPALKVPA